MLIPNNNMFTIVKYKNKNKSAKHYDAQSTIIVSNAENISFAVVDKTTKNLSILVLVPSFGYCMAQTSDDRWIALLVE